MSKKVPNALRIWFVIHFIADIFFAIPMFLLPVKFLSLLGWTTIDPIASRLVAAALFGIGIESLLGRNASVESFRTMLNLKIIWSAMAFTGILISMLQGAQRGFIMGWVILAIFLGFNFVWSYWRLYLRE